MLCGTGEGFTLVRTLVRLFGGHRLRLAGYFAAALATKVAVLFLCCRNEPKAATRLAQDR